MGALQVQTSWEISHRLSGCWQGALVAMAEGAPAKAWEEELLGLASRIGCSEPSEAMSMVAGVAPASSHKRRLAAIRLLPRTSPRCKQLRSAAILRLLPTLMLPTNPSKEAKVYPGSLLQCWLVTVADCQTSAQPTPNCTPLSS